MAEEKKRNYAREWETEKIRIKENEARIVVKTTPKINDDFSAKCAANGTNKNAVLKRYIERYTYENFDQ